jgi:hypothetical protein
MKTTERTLPSEPDHKNLNALAEKTSRREELLKLLPMEGEFKFPHKEPQ